MSETCANLAGASSYAAVDLPYVSPTRHTQRASGKGVTRSVGRHRRCVGCTAEGGLHPKRSPPELLIAEPGWDVQERARAKPERGWRPTGSRARSSR